MDRGAWDKGHWDENGTRVEWEAEIPAEPKRQRMANWRLAKQTQIW